MSRVRRMAKIGHLFAGVIRKIWFLFPNDKLYLQIIYFLEMGHVLNLKKPSKFTEKIQWLKIYDRKPVYTFVVDKITAKEYVANIVGSRFIIPNLGVWNNFDDIDFSLLPQKFVLKTNHGSASGGVLICKDKTTFNITEAKKKLEKGLRYNAYYKYREWPYKNIKPKIFAEELLEMEKDEELIDYKFFCFNGEPKFCQVIKDRRTKETIDFFDMEWKHLDFIGLNPKAEFSKIPPQRPTTLPQMIEVARKLSTLAAFCRVDMYETGDTCYFGEITLYPASGIGKFNPITVDEMMGSMLSLPKIP